MDCRGAASAAGGGLRRFETRQGATGREGLGKKRHVWVKAWMMQIKIEGCESLSRWELGICLFFNRLIAVASRSSRINSKNTRDRHFELTPSPASSVLANGCETTSCCPQATEDFIVHLLEDTNLCAIHAKRITISESPSRCSTLPSATCSSQMR